ncbi:MAG: PAS domain S-box protein, partial [Anaerolineaceae bacterium]|nr:PAS domain S-box protein [Anaerolineaceae bacterium]
MTKSHTYGKLWQTKFSSYNSDQKDQEKNILDQEYGDQPGLLFDKAFGLVILVNQIFCKFTGYKEDDVIGHHLSMIFPDLIINGKNFGDVFNQEIVLADQSCKIIKINVHKITSDDNT